jgi:signal transduction histidine kinase
VTPPRTVADEGAVADAPDDPDKKNPPLDFVVANLGRIGQTLPELLAKLRTMAELQGTPLPPELAQADANAQRIAAFAKYLDVFGRPDLRPPRALDLAQLTDGVIEQVRLELTRRAQLFRDYAAAPAVFATERALSLILLELLINAAHAGGDRLDVRLGSDARGWAFIEIEDNGSGIADEQLEKIFEPFYSTKCGAGKGLGLPIARQLVAELGGQIQVATAVGKGSRFRVELPPAAPSSSSPSAPSSGGARR